MIFFRRFIKYAGCNKDQFIIYCTNNRTSFKWAWRRKYFYNDVITIFTYFFYLLHDFCHDFDRSKAAFFCPYRTYTTISQRKRLIDCTWFSFFREPLKKSRQTARGFLIAVDESAAIAERQLIAHVLQ